MAVRDLLPTLVKRMSHGWSFLDSRATQVIVKHGAFRLTRTPTQNELAQWMREGTLLYIPSELQR